MNKKIALLIMFFGLSASAFAQDIVGESLKDMDFSSLLVNDSYKAAIYQIAKNLQAAMVNKLLFFSIALALTMSVYNYWSQNKAVGINISDLIRIIVLALMVSSYTLIYSTLDGSTDGIIGEFGQQNQQGSLDFYKYMTAREAKINYNLTAEQTAELAGRLTGNPNSDANVIKTFNNNPDQGMFGKTIGFFKSIPALINNTGYQFILSVSKWLLWVIKYIVSTFLVFYTAVVGIGGSLALTLSLMFNDGGIARSWLKNFLVSKLAFITFMIIEGINDVFYSLALSSKVTNTDMYSEGMDYLMIGLFFGSIVMYAMPIATTIKFTFSSSAGGFLSNATGAMLMAATMMTKGITKLAKGGK